MELDYKINNNLLHEKEKVVADKAARLESLEHSLKEKEKYLKELEISTQDQSHKWQEQYQQQTKELELKAVALKNIEDNIAYITSRNKGFLDRLNDPQHVLPEDHPLLQDQQSDVIKMTHFTDRAQSKRLCLFAHFDVHGFIDPWVIHYLEEIKKHDFDIALITTSPGLKESSFKQLSPLCRSVIHRKNDGIDFGSWRCGLKNLGYLQDYDELLIANDSVLGPFTTLDRIFEQVKRSPADLIGLTDTWQIHYHLQSYFLFFKKSLFKSETFHEFWQQVVNLNNKQEIIDRYELGLTRFILTAGYQTEALFPFEEIREKYIARLGTPEQYVEKFNTRGINPTIEFWDVLLQDAGFPFIKGVLLKSNPRNSTDILFWPKLVSADNEQAKQVVRYLQRTTNFAQDLC
jgi:hypothetical protein